MLRRLALFIISVTTMLQGFAIMS